MDGATDAQKLASSLTLFREAASYLLSQDNTTHDFVGLVTCCDQILTEISKQGYLPCIQTKDILSLSIQTQRSALLIYRLINS